VDPDAESVEDNSRRLSAQRDTPRIAIQPNADPERVAQMKASPSQILIHLVKE